MYSSLCIIIVFIIITIIIKRVYYIDIFTPSIETLRLFGQNIDKLPVVCIRSTMFTM